MSNELVTALQSAAGNAGGGDFYPYTIENSARIQGTSSKYLRRSTALASSPTNAQKLSFSCWIKLDGIQASGLSYIFQAISSGYPMFTFYDYSNYSPHGEGSWEFMDYRPSPEPRYLMRSDTISKQRDFSAWYHVYIVVDTTLSTGSDRYKIYLNGVEVPYTTSDQPTETPQNTDWHLFTCTTSAWGMYFGSTLVAAPTYGHDFYLAEAQAIDGTAYDISKFGEFKNGVWIPVEPSGISYGNGGFYLDFADSSNLGNDVSGNNNDFTSSGLTSSDQMIDTPTNNFATLNPLWQINLASTTEATLSDGNLTATTTSTPLYNNSVATMPFPPTGKWYCEVIFTGAVNSAIYAGVMAGLGQVPGATYNVNNFYVAGDSTGDCSISLSSGNKRINQANSAYGSAVASGSVVMIAVDMDSGKIWFGDDGTWFNSGDPAAGTGEASSTLADEVFLALTSYTASDTWKVNFGQTAFAHTPPTDFLELCTANLPEPTIGPNSTIKIDEVFAPILYTGNASARSIDVGFQPDLTWIKNRDAADNHTLFNVVRGATKYFSSNNTNAEATDANSLTAFDSIGFDLGTSSITNGNTEDYVAWNWKAGGTAVTNTDGSITSTVSANQDAGISVVEYSGSGAAATVGHGLSKAPSVILLDIYNVATNNPVYHSKVSATPWTGSLYLDLTIAVASGYPQYWNNTAPSSSVFSVGVWHSGTGNEHIAYCFAEVEGFSKFGSYTGNGSTDGPFIYCGFRPAFVMIKLTSTAGGLWIISDTARNTANVVCVYLQASANTADVAYAYIDHLSNGFKLRNTGTSINVSTDNYIYMAFAENPFKYSNAR